MFHVATGRSAHSDAYEAGRQAADRAQAQVARHAGRRPRPDLALVFGAAHYAQQRLIDGVAGVLGPDVVLVGCSSRGQITVQGVECESVVVMLIWPGSRLAVRPVLATDVGANPYAAGLALGRQVRAQLPYATDVTTRTKLHGEHFVTIRPYTLLLFSDSTGSDHALLAGAAQALGPAFQIAGGVASSTFRMEEACVYFNGTVHHDAAVGLAIGSRVPTAIGVCHGCHADHHAMRTAPADGNAIQQLGGWPAVELRAEFQNGHQYASPAALAVGLGDRNGYDSLHPPARLLMAGEAAQRLAVQWTECAAQCVFDAARAAAASARSGLGTAEPAAAMLFASATHLDRFGSSAVSHKLAAIRAVLGETVPIIGFYSHGEFGTPGNSSPDLYNQTCVLYVIGR